MSSCKQNPFLPLEHSLEIDSAYIGLPTALQPLSSPRVSLLLSFPSLRAPGPRSLGFLFRFHRAAPTVCRGPLCPLCTIFDRESQTLRPRKSRHRSPGCNGSRGKEGRREGRTVESIFPWSGREDDDLLASKNFIPLRFPRPFVRMNNSSLKNFVERVPLRTLNFAGIRISSLYY